MCGPRSNESLRETLRPIQEPGEIGSRRLRMLWSLDKVSPFKIDPLVIALSFTHSGPTNRCQDSKGGDRKSRSLRRPIPRENVSTFIELDEGEDSGTILRHGSRLLFLACSPGVPSFSLMARRERPVICVATLSLGSPSAVAVPPTVGCR